MDIDRIRTQRHVHAMVALDTFDAITARVRKLFSYDGRRITLAERITYTHESPRLHVGYIVDTHAYDGGINEGSSSGGRHFGVRLRSGRSPAGFGFSAYESDGNGTEAEAWRRYHAGEGISEHWHRRRRHMTRVTINGGMEGDLGPARDDLLIIEHWNSDGVCTEKVIGFDTDAYWSATGQADD